MFVHWVPPRGPPVFHGVFILSAISLDASNCADSGRAQTFTQDLLFTVIVLFLSPWGDVLMVSVSQVKLNHLTQLDCIFVRHLYMVLLDSISSLVSVLLDAEVKM